MEMEVFLKTTEFYIIFINFTCVYFVFVFFDIRKS